MARVSSEPYDKASMDARNDRHYSDGPRACVLSGAGVFAHHLHPDFLADQDATVERTIERIQFRQPHVVITMRTADSTVYTAEWQGSIWLHQNLVSPVPGPVTSDTLKLGDRIVVVGSPHCDTTRHELATLKEVRRPLDDWRWSCRRPEVGVTC
jgi:hypothetical protein